MQTGRAAVIAVVVGLSAAAVGVSGQVRATPVLTDDPMQVKTVPAGTRLDVMLKTPIDSGKVLVDHRFEAALLERFESQGQVVLAAGLVARGFVSSVRPSGKTSPQGQFTLSFDGLLVGDATLRLRATVQAAFDPKQADQLSRLGSAPAVGARTDSNLALDTVFVNESGTVVSRTGKDAVLPAGTVLRIRLDQPLEVPATR